MKYTRQSTHTLNKQQIIEKYINELKHFVIYQTALIPVWWQKETLTLTCWSIDDSKKPPGFIKSGDNRYQYNFTDITVPKRNRYRYRPVSYRMQFLLHPRFKDTTATVSHLCHNNACHNPDHLVLESLAINKSRNGCPGGPHCHHKTRCMIPGQYFDK
jgi:hypothetical protein